MSHWLYELSGCPDTGGNSPTKPNPAVSSSATARVVWTSWTGSYGRAATSSEWRALQMGGQRRSVHGRAGGARVAGLSVSQYQSSGAGCCANRVLSGPITIRDADPSKLQDPDIVAEAVLCALSVPATSAMAEVVVVPRNEPSWP